MSALRPRVPIVDQDRELLTIIGDVAAIERDHLVRTLGQVNGNKAGAARVLGVSRRALYRQLERRGLHTRVPADARATSTAPAPMVEHR